MDTSKKLNKWYVENGRRKFQQKMRNVVRNLISREISFEIVSELILHFFQLFLQAQGTSIYKKSSHSRC